MALLVIQDGVIQVERYQYGRTAQHRFLSNSMTKTITSMAVGLALREGRIDSLDDRADRYAPSLSGSLYGETTVRDLLRMSSGARFEERYDGRDDLARYGYGYGYGYQVWTSPSQQRRFALLGVYGQAIFVDPAQKLVMVHLAANATAKAGQTRMGREMGALWYGLVTHQGRW